MRCPGASCLACHTSGWSTSSGIKGIEHMKKSLTQQPAQRFWAAAKTWQQVLRSPAFVSLFLAALIVLLAWPRLTGPSWWALGMPSDLRESEGNTVQWEQIHLFNVLHATLESHASTAIEGHYNTDHYRALLPTYVAAIFAWWLDSSYVGFALVDLLGWWVAAWALYYLARRLDADHLSALTAAVLLAASPLLISFMWSQGLHVAHSASLIPCFLAALLFLADKRLAFGWRTVGLTCVLYVASVPYQYHWIIIPCLFSLVILMQQRLMRILAIATATLLFVAVTYLTHQILGEAGLAVSSRANDPFVRVSAWIDAGGMVDVVSLKGKVLSLSESLLRAYHPFIIVLGMIGLIFARASLRVLLFTGTVLGLASGYLYPVSWNFMNGYPFMYISAGLLLARGPVWLADIIAQIGSRRYPQFAEPITGGSRVLARLSTATLVLVAVWSTNADLLGDYSFAQHWWTLRYELR